MGLVSDRYYMGLVSDLYYMGLVCDGYYFKIRMLPTLKMGNSGTKDLVDLMKGASSFLQVEYNRYKFRTNKTYIFHMQLYYKFYRIMRVILFAHIPCTLGHVQHMLRNEE